MPIASIPYSELLAYAQSLSAFTSAPPNMPDLALPGQPPPPLFFPPFPNEEKMRRGRLNAEAPLGLLGETHSVGRRKHCLLYMTSNFDNYSCSPYSLSEGRRKSTYLWDEYLSPGSACVSISVL
jgi:Vitamin-D-receptor interacting Mediator subunit 4